MWKKLFLDHPDSVDESYFEHMGQAFFFSSRLFVGALCCFVHGLVPALFTKTGSHLIRTLNDRMVVNRNRKTHPLRWTVRRATIKEAGSRVGLFAPCGDAGGRPRPCRQCRGERRRVLC